jgi:Nucleotidyl transferase
MTDYGRRWAVILAGGDGTRLRPLTRELAGDDRPKQYCRVLGDETLLEQTRQRVSRSVSPCGPWSWSRATTSGSTGMRSWTFRPMRWWSSRKTGARPQASSIRSSGLRR